MDSLKIQKNRIDNEIQSTRDKRNIWLTACFAFPAGILGAFISIGRFELGVLGAGIMWLILNQQMENLEKKLESKINELGKLEDIGKRKK